MPSAPLYCSACYFAPTKTIEIGRSLHALKTDYTELHNVRYELMNADVWAEKLSEVLHRKIDEFEFNDQNRAEMKRIIERILDQLIVETDRIIRERNLSEHGPFVGGLKQLATRFLVDFDKLRERTPEFAEIIMDELESSRGRERIKGVLRTYLKKLATESFSPVDMVPYHSLLARYDCENRQACTPVLEEHIAYWSDNLDRFALGILSLAFILFLLIVWRGLPISSWELLLLILASTMLLALGIALPMIELEAKIGSLQLFVLGEPLSFSDQILFFQRKSIIDVVEILVATGEVKMIFVGILLTLFSIIFPLMKLFTIYVHFYDFRRLSSHAVVRFFAFRSGKWSMADVMVVAMFMAYLGFEGVIDNQMNRLDSASEYLNVLTTNGTQLEVGFFLFLGFVLLSLGTTTLIEKRALQKSS
uniref:Paraquat-inducible protein A n=1 Tax=Candidatus Kentrum sp. MB TaxID=2138164 RepID=A0A450XFV1_9GAMM|nr:MAG: Paraquat-inducible protein A [Candidatus Kentron sp. MB]